MHVVMAGSGSGLERIISDRRVWSVSALSTVAFFLLSPLSPVPCACVSALPPMAPVAGARPGIHYSEPDSSDPGLAVKGKFATKHLLMSSLFFMAYSVYCRLGTTWYLLFFSVVWDDVQMFSLCFFLHSPYNKYIMVQNSLEMFLSIWEQPESEEWSFWRGPGHCFCRWMVLEAV